MVSNIDIDAVIKNATNRIEENMKSFLDLTILVLTERLEGKINLQQAKIDEIHRLLLGNGLVKSVKSHEEELISLRPIKRVYWIIVSVLATGVAGALLSNILIKH